MFKGIVRCCALFGLIGGAAAAVQAQDYQYSVLVDADNRADTGCVVDLGGGNVAEGIERRLSAWVPSDTLQVESLTLEICAGAAFGPPQGVGGGYPVGLNIGTSGGDVVELGASVAELAGTSRPERPFRLVFAAESASGSDLLGSRDGAGGPPILFGTPPTPVPGLGLLGLLLLAAAFVLILRSRRFRPMLRRGVLGLLVLGSGLVIAANFVLDGAIGDWSGVSPAATDAVGDSTSGQSAIDILAGFAAFENERLYFRVDIRDTQNNAPLADPLAVAALEDTALTITLSGSDDEGAPLTFAIASAPANGTLGAITPVSPTTAEVVYTPNADFNGADSFTFTVDDGDVTSAPATVSIAVAPVNDAPGFTAQNATLYEDGGAQTATVAIDLSAGPPDEAGQALSFEITANDNAALFSGTPTISPAGVLSATPAAGQLGSANLTVVLHDDGGIADGGIDVSPPQVITVTVDDVNDPPSFTPGANPAVLEDAGAQTIANWATAIDDGDGGGQTLTFIVQNNSNPALFDAAPAISPTGTLSFTAAADAFGSADVTIVLQDNGGTGFGGNDTSPPATFTITVDAVNDAPSFTAVDPPAVFEDNGPVTVPAWAAFDPGPDNESAQTALEYQVSAISNPALFSAPPSVDPATGALSYTPAASTTGTSTFTVRVRDSGGVANGGIDLSPPQTFTIDVDDVNDPPSFTPGANPTVLEDAGAQSIANWATAIDDGDDGTQALTFIVQNNSNPALFTALPAITPTGTLSFTTAADANGSADVTIVLQDDGGTGNGGNDTSPPVTFTINVTAVNDAPSFVLTDPPAVPEDAGAQSAGVAGSILPGPIDENTQNVLFTLNPMSSDPTLSFIAAPAIAANGTLSYTAAPDAWGTATFEVLLADDGGTANGGVNTSPPQTLTITIAPVNDAPSFTAADPPASNEDAGAQTVAGWVTGFNPGPNETGQAVLEYVVAVTGNPALFTLPPAVSPAGTLTYTTATDAFGTATISVQVRDDGGIAGGGIDLSPAQTFTITVDNVNDPPVIDLNGPAPGTGFAASFTEGGAPAAIVDAAAATVTDIDSAELASLTVTITNLLDGADEVLAVDLTGSGLSALYLNGVLTVSGNAAPSVYQTVLRTATYANASNNPDPTARAIEFIAQDVEGGFIPVPAVATVSVAGINSAPSFTPGASPAVLEDSGAYDQPWATALSDGDDGTQALAFIVQNNSNPALFAAGPSISGTTGNLSFTPAVDANGSADITIVLQDDGGTGNGGNDTSPPVTFTISLTAVNDAPGFTAADPPAVLEDSGAASVAGWASFNAGPANESSQVALEYQISAISNPALFSAPPSVDPATGTLSYTPAADASGSAQFTVRVRDDGGTANGGVDLSAPQTFTITVNGINDAPSFAPGGQPTSLEDEGAFDAPWATGLNDGDGGTQTLTFVIQNNTNPALFAAGPAVSGSTGNLSYTPAADAFGSADITIVLQDDGGTANGGQNTSAPFTFTISVVAINDAPSFVVPATAPPVLENAGAQTVNAFATAISAGPANEAGQVLTFNVSVTGTTGSLAFASAPAIDPLTGHLTYTAQNDTSGTATVQVTLSDNGGTAFGGIDTSAAQSFTIEVLGVNSAPSFVPGPAVTVLEDSAAYDQPWATALDDGDLGETQALTFVVQNNSNPALFAAGPAVSGSTGNLSFTPAADAFGSADITIVLQDDGGTANGGNDTSPPVTFTITLTGINDAPSFDAPAAAPGSVEDAGPQTVANFASNLSTGPANESTQTLLGFSLSIDSIDPTLSFSAAPALSPTGTLSYTAAANAFGTATLTATLQDNGGTANGGIDTFSRTFTITVAPVNDAPSFTSGGNVGVLEDAGPTSLSWATDIDDGDGGTQTLTFNITANSNPTLFSAGPTINSAGNLSFTPATNAFGTASITVTLSDNGGTANGGIDTSPPVSFTINVTAVNDPPVVVAPSNVPVTRHIGIVIPAAHASNLLAGVSDPADGAGAAPFILTTQSSALTANSGRVTVNADGSWNYDPPASNTLATDSFNFEVCDSGVPGSACTIANATITLSGNAVWFVNDDAPPGGDGTLARPFQTIDAATAAAGLGGRIFVFSGNYTGGATLASDQILIGQGVSIASATSFDAVFGITPPATSVARPTIGGARPLITTAGAVNGLNLGNGNSVRGVEIGNTGGSGLAGASVGALTLGDNRISGSGQALSLSTGTITQAASSTAFDQVSSSSGGFNVALTAINGTVDLGNGALTGATTAAFQISGGSATVTYGGSITAGSGARPVNIENKTAGTVTLNGAVTSTAQGVRLASNTGATIRFAGSVSLSTGANAAFSASGGGTVEVCDENPCAPALTGSLVNTLNTGTGVALDVRNTTIGGNGLVFRSISANGGANGIVLSSTGSAGGLTVTGNGGTCSEGSATCSGGWIRNMTGGDDAGATPIGTGIVLNSTANVSLTRMRINDTSNYGIRGTSVAGFTFANGVLDGAHGGNVSTPFNEGSLVFFGVTGVSSGMTGTSSISNSTIMGGRQRNIAIDNSVGTLDLTVSNNIIKRSSDAAGDDGFFLEADTNANVILEVTNNTFARHGGDHINVTLVNSAVADVTITGNTLHGNYAGTPEGNHPIGLGQGIFIFGATFNGSLTYEIANNGSVATPFRGNRQGGAIHVNKGSGNGTFTGSILDNVIGDPAIPGSGSAEAFGIIVGARGAGGSHTTLIDGNLVREYFDRGIVLEAGEGSAALNATVTNNTVSDFADTINSLHGIHSDNGILPGDNNAVCLHMASNTVGSAGNEPAGGFDIRLRRGSNTTVRLPGLAGTTNAQAISLLQGNNPTATSVTATGDGYSGGAACPLP